MKALVLALAAFTGTAVLANADDKPASTKPATPSATPGPHCPEDALFRKETEALKSAAEVRIPARKHFEKVLEAFKAGRATASELLEAHRQWTDAEQASCACTLFSQLTPEQAAKLIQAGRNVDVGRDEGDVPVDDGCQEFQVVPPHENCVVVGAMYAKGLSEALIEGALTEEEAQELAAGFEAMVAAKKARVDLLRTVALLERVEKCKDKEAAKEARHLLSLLPQRKELHLVQPSSPISSSVSKAGHRHSRSNGSIATTARRAETPGGETSARNLE